MYVKRFFRSICQIVILRARSIWSRQNSPLSRRLHVDLDLHTGITNQQRMSLVDLDVHVESSSTLFVRRYIEHVFVQTFLTLIYRHKHVEHA